MDQDKLRVLSRPFTDIKTRPGRNGQGIQYVEGHQVVHRLNEALSGDWSFRVLEHEVMEQEVLVLVELRHGEVIKHAFGGSELTRTRDGKVVSIADDLKSAATDALKKAATLLGVGLQPCAAEEVPARSNGAVSGVVNGAAPAAPQGEPQMDAEEGVPPTNRLTRKQLAFIHRLGREQGLDAQELEGVSRGRYGKASAFLSVHEASDFIQDLQHPA